VDFSAKITEEVREGKHTQRSAAQRHGLGTEQGLPLREWSLFRLLDVFAPSGPETQLAFADGVNGPSQILIRRCA
jgi:hypothetical protein